MSMIIIVRRRNMGMATDRVLIDFYPYGPLPFLLS